ncbi:MAG: flagellar hook-length control protein FliK [Flavobacteriaceae bacterium]
MAVSPSASGLPAVLAALAGAEGRPALNSGDIIAARVSAQLSGELARLLFRGGAIDVKLPRPLPAGSEVVFQVQRGGTNPTIAILRIQTPGSTQPQPSAPATIVTASQPAAQPPPAPAPTAPSSPQSFPAPTTVPASAPASVPSDIGQPNAAGASPSSLTSSSPPAAVPSASPQAQTAPQGTAALAQGQVRLRAGPQAPGAAQAEVVPPPSTGNRTGLPPRAEAAVAAAKSDSAAKQSGLAGLFAEAEALLSLSPARAAVPAPVMSAIVRLLGLRIAGEATDPSALREAIRRSGVQTEALLARGVPVTGDLKTALQALRRSLIDWIGRESGSPLPENRPPPPQRGAPLHGEPPRGMSFAGEPHEAATYLLARIEGALHRVRLLQIASLPDRGADPAADTPELMIEIPLVMPGGTGTVQMRLASELRSKDGRPEKGWRVRFSLEPGEAGPTHASVGLVGEAVDVSLYAENAPMAGVLEAGLNDLRDALCAAGLVCGEITAGSGKPRPAARSSGFFLDRRS